MFWYFLAVIALAVTARALYLRQRRKAAWAKMARIRGAYAGIAQEIAAAKMEMKWLEQELGIRG